MKSFLIIPMGGTGSRFIKAGYKKYKPFLPANNKKTIFYNIINNFSKLKTELIVLANQNYLGKKNIKLLKKLKCNLINIPNHKKGPLFSIRLGLNQINKIVKKNENIFICYSDINWSWNISEIRKKILKAKSVIFTHTGFHPHLHVNSKSDFCLKKKDEIVNISEKKTFGNNYQNEFLAIGCYFIKNIHFLNDFFAKNKLKNKKEYYLTTLVKYLLNQKVKIRSINVSKFVHLGTPEQYEDYRKWGRYNLSLKKPLKKKQINTTIMLMGGKGKRMYKITKLKPFLHVNKKPIFQAIFENLNSKEKIVITNKNLQNKIDKKKHKLFITRQTNSMFETVYSSKKLLQKKSNYFLTSCDCLGIAKQKSIRKFLTKNKKDLIFFAFKFSNFQKSLGNSHSQIFKDNKNNIKIKVKSSSNRLGYGHAGYFWIKNPKVFLFMDSFKRSKYFKNLNREVLIDDYFKYLVDRKLVKSNFYILEDYIHIGSEKEYREYNYWSKYFSDK